MKAAPDDTQKQQRPAYTMTKDEALWEATYGALGQLCREIIAAHPELFPDVAPAASASPIPPDTDHNKG